MSKFGNAFPRRLAVVLGAGLLLASAGCTRVQDHKGYVLDQTLAASVQPGVDNRDSVTKTLGRPSFTAQFGEDVWYYVSRNTKSLNFQKPKASEQTVLAVRFDKAGNVASIDRTGLEQIASITPMSDKTPTLGRNRGFFAELFGNIGQVGSMGQGSSSIDNPN